MLVDPSQLDADSTSNLKERSIKGGTITLFTQVISYVITVASTVILARLLTPEDYGIVAMVTAMTGFINLFRELGLSGATIQSREISHDQLSTLFWINVGLGTLITIITMASAPLIALFYNKPQLISVTIGLSFSSLLSSIGTQHGALLNRQMRFKTIAAVQVSAMLIGFFTAVIIALCGGAYWALVSNNIMTISCISLGFWITSGFRPKLPKRGTRVAQFIRFGASIVGFDFFYYFHDNMDQILIGRVWGPQQLGLYTKAYSLLMLPLSNLRYPLNKVAFPAMSRLTGDPVRYRSYYIKYCSLLAFASMPLVAVLFACSENIIRLFLGIRWIGAVELFRILAIAGFIQSVASLRTTVILSSGHGKRLFRWGFFNASAAVIAFLCGLPWGARGVAIAFVIFNYIVLHPSLLYSFKDTPIRIVDFYRSIAKPGIASITMCVIYIMVIRNALQGSDFTVLLISLPICLLLYIIVFLLLPAGMSELINYYKYLRYIFVKSS